MRWLLHELPLILAQYDATECDARTYLTAHRGGWSSLAGDAAAGKSGLLNAIKKAATPARIHWAAGLFYARKWPEKCLFLAVLPFRH